MGDFFHGWRNKAGVVTLGVACVFATLWMRGHVACDIIAFPLQGRQHTIVTVNDAAYWMAMTTDKVGWAFQPDVEIAFAEYAAEEIGKEFAATPHLNYRRLIVPYRPIVVPLTLLSAYLLLWKRRKRV